MRTKAVCMWLFLLGIYTTDAELQIINVTYTTCRFFNTYRPYTNVEYSLVWLGKDLPETESCNIKFKPFEEDHEICIESGTFLLEDCRIKMISYDGEYAHHVKKTYTCNDNSAKFCGFVDSFVGIKLIVPRNNRSQEATNSIRLKVTVVYHFNIMLHWRLITGCVSAFLWLPWIVLGRIYCCQDRTKVLQWKYSRLRSINSDATTCPVPEDLSHPGHVIPRPSEDDGTHSQPARANVVVHT